MQDLEQQANMVLFVVVVPLVWMGCSMYYKREQHPNGYVLGLSLFLTSAVLDALITVPLLIIPNGGSYYNFYVDVGFWAIAFEFIAVAVLHWYSEIRKQKKII